MQLPKWKESLQLKESGKVSGKLKPMAQDQADLKGRSVRELPSSFKNLLFDVERWRGLRISEFRSYGFNKPSEFGLMELRKLVFQGSQERPRKLYLTKKRRIFIKSKEYQ